MNHMECQEHHNSIVRNIFMALHNQFLSYLIDLGIGVDGENYIFRFMELNNWFMVDHDW